jgi:hypothetical protein
MRWEDARALHEEFPDSPSFEGEHFFLPQEGGDYHPKP